VAKKSGLIINIEYAAARVAFGLLGVLPRRAAIAFCVGLMRLLPLILLHLRRTGMRNLEIAFPEKSVAERKKILAGSLENLGRVLGELSQNHKYSRERFAEMVEIDMDEETQELYRRNREEGLGIVITTGHFGNWEMFVLGFAASFQPISYLARPLDNPKIDAMLNARRDRFGNRPINKAFSAMTAIKLVREGGILGILADVNTHPREGVFVPFFGVPACTSAGAATIAIRAGAVIYPAVCVYDRDKDKYRMIRGEIIVPENTGDRERDIRETTARFTLEMEKFIRLYPDQWMWIHRRWKTRPPGEPSVY
jgi:KDO2-lipid IV(A) lauroyltransferase